MMTACEVLHWWLCLGLDTISIGLRPRRSPVHRTLPQLWSHLDSSRFHVSCLEGWQSMQDFLLFGRRMFYTYQHCCTSSRWAPFGKTMWISIGKSNNMLQILTQHTQDREHNYHRQAYRHLKSEQCSQKRGTSIPSVNKQEVKEGRTVHHTKMTEWCHTTRCYENSTPTCTGTTTIKPSLETAEKVWWSWHQRLHGDAGSAATWQRPFQWSQLHRSSSVMAPMDNKLLLSHDLHVHLQWHSSGWHTCASHYLHQVKTHRSLPRSFTTLTQLMLLHPVFPLLIDNYPWKWFSVHKQVL